MKMSEPSIVKQQPCTAERGISKSISLTIGSELVAIPRIAIVEIAAIC